MHQHAGFVAADADFGVLFCRAPGLRGKVRGCEKGPVDFRVGGVVAETDVGFDMRGGDCAACFIIGAGPVLKHGGKVVKLLLLRRTGEADVD